MIKNRSIWMSVCPWATALLVLCLMAGCGGSSAKPDAAAKSSQQPFEDLASGTSHKAALQSDSPLVVERKAEPSPSSLGATERTASKPTVLAAAEDDRYASVTPNPKVAHRVDPPVTLSVPGVSGTDAAAYFPHPAAPRIAAPPAVPPTATDGASVANPLRDPNAGTTTDRPKMPEKTEPDPLSAGGVSPMPTKAAAQSTTPAAGKGRNVELSIQSPGDATITEKKPADSEGAKPDVPKPETDKKDGREPSLGDGLMRPKTSKHSDVKFDPIKENGPIFVNWPKPDLALVITGRQEGYLEPCGCAGFTRMKGGMSRRYTMLQMLRAQGWPVVGLDVGGTAKGYGKQAELKFQIAIEAMRKMRYNSVGLGLPDLKLPPEEVLAMILPSGNQKGMFVSGNVGLFQFDESILPRTQLISAGFKTIGLTSVLGKSFQEQLAGNTSLAMIAPDKLLQAAVPKLKDAHLKDPANFLVLLAYADRKETLDLVEKFPDFDLVITAGGMAEPPAQPEEIHQGKTKLIEVGEKGMYAVVLGFYKDPKQPMRYQRVTLDSRFESSPEMVALMAAYQDQIKNLGLEGLGIRPLSHPQKEVNGTFVGSDKCANCHAESYRVWKKTIHSQAFATLKKANPPRNFDPECISCHTVGWHPTKYFPYEGGFTSELASPKLMNVGCEDCHGPGEKHVRAENQGTKAEQLELRKAVAISKEEAANPNSKKQNCYSCHDLDNSPEFKFDLYWPNVEHHERE